LAKKDEKSVGRSTEMVELMRTPNFCWRPYFSICYMNGIFYLQYHSTLEIKSKCSSKSTNAYIFNFIPHVIFHASGIKPQNLWHKYKLLYFLHARLRKRDIESWTCILSTTDCEEVEVKRSKYRKGRTDTYPNFRYSTKISVFEQKFIKI